MTLMTRLLFHCTFMISFELSSTYFRRAAHEIGINGDPLMLMVEYVCMCPQKFKCKNQSQNNQQRNRASSYPHPLLNLLLPHPTVTQILILHVQIVHLYSYSHPKTRHCYFYTIPL
jgi:hypothetical protein